MANINISGLSEEEKQRYSRLADESGASSRSQFVRERLRAGVMLWEASGGFDTELLDRPFDDQQNASEDSLTDHDRSDALAEVRHSICRKLSTSDPTSIQELEAAIVRDLVADALYDLQQQGRVENVPTKGYTKVADE